MERVRVGPVELEYEVLGEGPPLVLIMGIGGQLIHWPDPLCQLLVDQGLRVIRFDNRDAGRSTWLDELPAPAVATSVLRGALGLRVAAPYRLSDMARDTVGLIEALGLESAHVVGLSMGGMIAQTIAIEHPDRVRSLTSLSSTPGDRRVPKPRAIRALMQPVPRTRSGAIERSVAIMRAFGTPTYPLEEEAFRGLAERAYDRGATDAGFRRQFAAITASGSRNRLLRGVAAPTLVIHGDGDPLIPVSAGRATAELIPGAELEVIPGMGHDLPRPLWPRLAERIARHALAAEAAAPAAQ